MDLNPFFIRFLYQDSWIDAKVRPCCRIDNVVDYAVWIKGKLEFTLTRNDHLAEGSDWVVALKNADNKVDNQVVQVIGQAIDQKRAETEQKNQIS